MLRRSTAYATIILFFGTTILLYVSSWTSLYMDGSAVNLFLLIFPHEAGTWDPNYTPGVNFLTMIFYNPKNSSQDLSNEGSIFILNSLEVDH